MNWIEDLVLRRKAQNSNVMLVETLDFKRIDQFRELLKDGSFSKLVGWEYEQVVEHDIQRQSLHDVRTGQDIPLNPMETLYSQLDKMLTNRKTIALIKYVILPVHAEALSNPVVPWSHDDPLYKTMSTVIVFTANLGLFNDNVRRLCYQISIPPSTAEERETILAEISKNLAEGYQAKYGTKVDLGYDARHINASSGLTLHDIETASLESFHLHRRFDTDVFTNYKIKILKNYGMEWIEPRRGFESVGGYQYLKDYVTKRVIKVITHPEQAKKYGLDVPRGILLIGPPGVGKTHLSKAVAKESGLPMLKVTPADYMRSLVGESEQRMKQITQLIETLNPVIVFLDEFDQFSMRRDQQFIGDSGVNRRTQNMMLDWLGDETRRSFVVGATNFIDLDPAFIRAGRIDDIVLVLPPDCEARREILRVHIAARRLPIGDVDLDMVAGETFAWTGAELERLVKEAAALAMDAEAEKVTGDHFMDGVKCFEVNADERMRNVQTMIQKLKNLEQVNQKFLNEALKAFAERDEAADSRVRGLISTL